MFSHIFIGVTDFDRALAFYQPVMAALGIAPRFVDAAHPWAGWQNHPNPRPLFLIGRPFEGEHAPGNGQMTAFVASTRVVLIKGYDERGIVWFTNYDSRKGRQIAGNPYAALQFHWVELERVVRIEGVVEKVSDAESDEYFNSRPLDSRIGAWASPQSQVISGRGVLVANAAKYGAQFMLKPPRPPHWGGYRLKPDQWEFGQGRKSRLHDRLRYRLDGGEWVRERLAP